MRPSTQKSLWWWMLALGAGGLILFVVASIVEKHLKSFFLLWLIASLILTVWPLIRLHTLYRRHPATGPGLWQLQMTDLLCAAAFVGLFFALWNALSVQTFLVAGVPTGLGAGIAFIVGLLTAARKGAQHQIVRAAFALGYSIRLFGALGCGGLSGLVLITLLRGAEPSRICKDLFLEDWSVWPRALLRLAMISLPVGILLCHLTTRGLPREQAPRDTSRDCPKDSSD